MRVRAMSKTGDMTFGRNLSNFHVDKPEAVAQVVLTRLNLWTGQWWLDLTEGTPYETKVLGKYTGAVRDAVLRMRIAQTPGVKAIVSYGSQVNRETRAFGVQAQIDTVYGPAEIVEPK